MIRNLSMKIGEIEPESTSLIFMLKFFSYLVSRKYSVKCELDLLTLVSLIFGSYQFVSDQEGYYMWLVHFEKVPFVKWTF